MFNDKRIKALEDKIAKIEEDMVIESDLQFGSRGVGYYGNSIKEEVIVIKNEINKLLKLASILGYEYAPAKSGWRKK